MEHAGGRGRAGAGAADPRRARGRGGAAGSCADPPCPPPARACGARGGGRRAELRRPGRAHFVGGRAGGERGAGDQGAIARSLERRRERRARGGAGPALPDMGDLEEVGFPLARGASVRLLCPAREPGEAARDSARLYGEGGALESLYSRVVWPSGQALARDISRSSFMVRGKRILELGCGLGLPAAAAAAAGAASVTCSDIDGPVAQVAAASCLLNFPQGGLRQQQGSEKEGRERAEALTLDWDRPEEWPQGAFDVALAADVLYRPSFAGAVAAVLGRSLDAPHGRALLADPVQRPFRDVFAERCAEHGLQAAAEVCPDDDEVIFVTVSGAGGGRGGRSGRSRSGGRRRTEEGGQGFGR